MEIRVPHCSFKKMPKRPFHYHPLWKTLFLTIYSVTLSIPKYIRVKYLPRTYTSYSWSSEAPDFSFQMSTRPLKTKLILPPPKCAPPFSGHYNNQWYHNSGRLSGWVNLIVLVLLILYTISARFCLWNLSSPFNNPRYNLSPGFHHSLSEALG